MKVEKLGVRRNKLERKSIPADPIARNEPTFGSELPSSQSEKENMKSCKTMSMQQKTSCSQVRQY